MCLFINLIIATTTLFTVSCGTLVFTRIPTDEVVVPGQALWWHCEAKAVPPTRLLSYKWLYNGDPVTASGPRHKVWENGTLFLAFVQQMDLGTPGNPGRYQCTAFDGESTITSPTIRLTQAYLARSYSIQPSDQMQYAGSSIILQCEINSLPPAVITWMFMKHAVSKGAVIMVTQWLSQLNLNNIQYTDAGQYGCLAKNSKTNQTLYSKEATLVVQGGPVFKESPKPVRVPQLGTAVLNCEVYANPTPTVKWSTSSHGGDSYVLTNSSKYTVYLNGSLRVNEVLPVDGGFYTCTASNSVGTITSRVLLSVTDPASAPSFTRTPANTTVQEGSRVGWGCAATGNPSPTITWRKLTFILCDQSSGPLPVGRVTYPYLGALSLSSVQNSDSGHYVCTASNENGVTTHSVFLNVQTAPVFTITPPSVITVNTSDPLFLNCQAGGNPGPTYQWETTHGTFYAGDNDTSVLVFVNGTLHIQSLTKEWGGRYICRAKNVVGLRTLSTYIIVNYPPTLITRPQDLQVVQGTAAMLPCQADGEPLPLLLWYDTDLSLPLLAGDDHRTLANGSLLQPSVELDQEGMYQCMAQNLLGKVNAYAFLTVLVPPTIANAGGQLVVKPGESVVLGCEVDGKPWPGIQWTHNNSQLFIGENTLRFPNNTLLISAIRLNQFGTYTCNVTNEAGYQSITYILYPYDPPNLLVPPRNVTANLTGSIQIQCQGNSSQPMTTVWLRETPNGSELVPPYNLTAAPPQRVYVIGSGTLIMQTLALSDEGWYECVLANGAGNISAKAFLKLQVPPSVPSTNKSGVAEERGNMTLTCSATGNPHPEVEWVLPRKQGVVLTSEPGYELNETSITIKNISVRQHWGDWKCKACNILGCSESIITLLIQGPPVLLPAVSYVQAAELTIQCSAIGSPTPVLSYRWGKLQVTFANPPPGHRLEMATLKVALDSKGTEYSCLATNTHGLDVQSFSLPAPPGGVRVTSITSTSLEISWDAAKAGGLGNVTYLLQVATTNYPSGLTRRHAPYGFDMMAQSFDVHNLRSRRAVDTWVTSEPITTTPYKVADLKPYRNYKLRVASVTPLGQSNFTVPVTVSTPAAGPSFPVNLKITFVNLDLHLTWDPPANPNGNPADLQYDVSYLTKDNSMLPVTLQRPYVDPRLLNLGQIKYNIILDVYILVVNTKLGMSSKAAILNFHVKHPVLKLAPVLVKLTPKGFNMMHMEWKPPKGSAAVWTGFRVRVQKAGETTPARFVPAASPTLTNFTVDGLTEKTRYALSVALVNLEGSGPLSNVLEAKTGVDPFGAETIATEQLSATSIGIITGVVAGIILLLTIVFIILVMRRARKRRRRAAKQAYAKTMIVTAAAGTKSETVSSRQSGITGEYNLLDAAHRQPSMRISAPITQSVISSPYGTLPRTSIDNAHNEQLYNRSLPEPIHTRVGTFPINKRRLYKKRGDGEDTSSGYASVFARSPSLTNIYGDVAGATVDPHPYPTGSQTLPRPSRQYFQLDDIPVTPIHKSGPVRSTSVRNNHATPQNKYRAPPPPLHHYQPPMTDLSVPVSLIDGDDQRSVSSINSSLFHGGVGSIDSGQGPDLVNTGKQKQKKSPTHGSVNSAHAGIYVASMLDDNRDYPDNHEIIDAYGGNQGYQNRGYWSGNEDQERGKSGTLGSRQKKHQQPRKKINEAPMGSAEFWTSQNGSKDAQLF